LFDLAIIKAINRPKKYNRRERIYLISYSFRQDDLAFNFGRVQVLAKNKDEAVKRFSLGDLDWLKNTIKIESVKAI